MDNADNEDLSLLASNLAIENAELIQRVAELDSIVNALEKQLDEANNKLDSINSDMYKLYQHLQFSLDYTENINKLF